jgi:hypothetical protein
MPMAKTAKLSESRQQGIAKQGIACHLIVLNRFDDIIKSPQLREESGG